MNIYDIAKAANVSVSTVSRVLNGKKNIKEETRRRVQQVLDENNYMPNALAQGLANNSMHVVGLLVTDIRQIHHAETAYALEREFSRFGYGCTLCNVGEEEERQEVYLRMLAMRQVDGLVFLGSVFQNSFIEKQIKKYHPETPVVIANGYLPLKNVSGVLCDDASGVCKSVEYLIGRGHRQIGFVQNYTNYSADQKRRGYLEGHTQAGLTASEANIEMSVCSIEGGMAATQRLLERNPTITAIVFGEDLAAVGGVKMLARLGRRVPEDVEVIGFDNSIYAETSSPSLTSVDSKLRVLGLTAARTLDDMINGVEVTAKTVLSQEIVFRDSTLGTGK